MLPNFGHKLMKRNMIIGGRQLLPPPSNFPVLPAAQSDGASPKAPGRLVGQTWGRPDRHWLDPVRDGQPVKVHCCQRWWVTLTPSGSGGAVKEGESMSVRERLVGEGQGVSLEKIRRGYGDMNRI